MKSGRMKSGVTINIHASCVALGGKGVLLLGASGVGKSDLALRLVDGGARLVADDRSELWLKNGVLFARAPATIAGLIEVRGLGIIALPYSRQVPVALAVRLGQSDARLPKRRFYAAPLTGAGPVPMITMDGREPSAPARIRMALAAFSRGLFTEDLQIDPSRGK